MPPPFRVIIEQHWFLWTDEDVLYLHARGLVTAVNDILNRCFEDDLSSHLPLRVLPVSTQAPKDIDFIVDREFKKIGELLAPCGSAPKWDPF